MPTVSELISGNISNAITNVKTWGGVIYNVKEFGAKGDGVADDTLKLSDAVSSTGDTGGIVFLPPGTYNINANLMVPANVTLQFANGAKLNIASSVTVTINGPIEAGLHQIFSGQGTVNGTPKVPAVYPQWWGAKGDGVTDDANAIQKAINLAKATNGILYFPASSGNYRTSQTIYVDPSFVIRSDGGATIAPIGSVTDGIVFTPGNYYHRYVLPNVVNFVNGAGVKLDSANLLYIEFHTIANCKNGLVLQANATQACLDNTIRGVTINTCTNGAAIRMVATQNGAVMQGNHISMNFLNTNLYGIYFDSPAGSTINWDDNVFEIDVIEGAGVANSTGIATNNGGPPARVTFRVPSFFGGFGSSVWVSGGGGNHNIYELAFVGSNIPYSAVSLNGVGNIIRNIGNHYSAAITGPAIQAATAPNSRATYNSGIAVFSNKQYIQMNVPNLSAGQTADFYIYSPFTTGYSHMLSITPHFSQPLAVMCLEDTSIKPGIDGNASPNQIHIRLIALGNVSASQQFATVTIGY